MVLDLRRSEGSLIRVTGKVTDQTVESNWRWNTFSERRGLIYAEVLSFSDYRSNAKQLVKISQNRENVRQI